MDHYEELFDDWENSSDPQPEAPLDQSKAEPKDQDLRVYAINTVSVMSTTVSMNPEQAMKFIKGLYLFVSGKESAEIVKGKDYESKVLHFPPRGVFD